MGRFVRWTATAAGIATAITVAVALPATGHTPKSLITQTDPVDPTGHQVTLITGDVVQLVQAAPGRYAASVRPAPGRERVTFHTTETEDGLQVIPADVVPYLSSGLLDPGLFDVKQLIADGYDDRSAPNLPLIVKFQDPKRGQAQTFTGATTTTALPSIGGAALSAGKGGLSGFWKSISGSPATATASPRLAAGLDRIWLDARVRTTLDRSVAQIGAPDAWRAGYDGTGVDVAVLDTGVDAAHPDLTGKVTSAENFTDDPAVTDGHGHGTHVASTVAGNGPTHKGVAPGANLLIGKVLDDDGSGQFSWVIAGMEWAVRQGAEVVNMSLGAGATDGKDPLSEAVNTLTAQSGTLFVVAAGNVGGMHTIGSPGAADAALTVGAVERDERLAGFSSRGPRLGDNGLKPEITAPGVGIVAARAAGTAMGDPVDARYTAASGTSMATPHVAGAAALLAQANPQWRAARLKDALTGTARINPGLTVFEQGSGRVDVARAVSQRVRGTGAIDFGMHADAPGLKPVVKRLVYHNDSAAEVRLDLKADLRNLDGGPAGTDALTLESAQVTVPPGSSAEVGVTLDAAKLARGLHGGWITATGPDGISVRTSVGTTFTGPIRKVTLRALDRKGEPTWAYVVTLFGERRGSDVRTWLRPGQPRTVEVEEGDYILHGVIEDGDRLDEQATLITDPEIEITKDTEIVLDAREGAPVRILTPQPAEQREIFSYYLHRVMGNKRTVSHGVMHFSNIRRLNVTPTERVRRGEFEFSSRWQLVAPMVVAQVRGLGGPLWTNLLHQSPVYDGRREFRLVYAGTGKPAELAAAKPRGAAVVMTASPEITEREQVTAAAAAGASAALIVRDRSESPWTVWRPVGDREPIPALVVAHDDGLRLIEAARPGRARLELTLTVSSPYLYDVFHVERDRVPDEITHRVTRANSMRRTTRYADYGGFGWAKEQRFGWRPWQSYSWNDFQRIVATPSTREEWISAGDSLWQHRVHHLYTWDEMNPLSGGFRESPRTYAQGSDTMDWITPVVRPAIPADVPGIVSSRSGDVLAVRIPEFTDARGHYAFGDEGESKLRLWRDGTPIAERPDAWRNIDTTPDPAAYRLTLTTERNDPEWIWATRTETTWGFRSARPAGDRREPLPLLQVDYDVPVDRYGRVSGRHAHTVELTLRHQTGLNVPRDTEVEVEVSFDEGRTWTETTVRGHGTRYRVTVPRAEGAESVSLRINAEDSRDNEITQTVVRAYGLR
ncbi:S8 family serine peptidase [Rhizohabitans arisaemae]|uniref:S8 family serine peptidase n=1 Tax=Rhizohabitans arisaemae TaxID=2720610 RepID=UPI0024B28333|nr:S8 family serine peptidase [Rhizohabitans arisaemae]